MGLTLRRAAGAALLVTAYAPAHRLLDPARAGPAGAATQAAAETAWLTGLYGTLMVAGAAWIASRVVDGARLMTAAHRVVDVLARPRSGHFAAATAAVAFSLSGLLAHVRFGRMPTSVDEAAQLLHARALADGLWTVPLPGPDAAWIVQNGVRTADGWAAIYPPLHTLALAAGLAVGAAWLVGPLLLGVATGVSTLVFDRLLGQRHGRAAGALLAVSPFWLLLGATHLSHTAAAAALVLVAWTAMRAREGGLARAAVCGGAVGAAVCARPWIGLASSLVIVAALWLADPAHRPSPSAAARRLGALVAGGMPFAALLFAWNTRLFGAPLRLGYSAAFGPAHGLGLHTDPWGNRYGLLEATAYTGADLVQLGIHLLESPVPALALVGAGLLVSRDTRTAVFAAWAAAAVGANALYWHHGIHLGPRMLFESTPAWIALLVGAAAALAGRQRSPSLAGWGAWAICLGLGTGLVLAPGATLQRTAGIAASGVRLPMEIEGGAIVFAHGSWASRIGARLAAAGMRRDSIETALRRNDICAVDRYARWRAAGQRSSTVAPQLDLVPLPGSPPELEARVLSAGNPVRMAPGGAWDATCTREALADRLGIVELEPLLWQAPPTASGAGAVARDLGPMVNARVREAFPGPAWVLIPTPDGAGVRLLDYDDGMELLWRGAAAAADRADAVWSGSAP